MADIFELTSKIKRTLLEAPLMRAICFILANVVAGVLSGAFVFEIMTPTGIKWALSYHSKSFYLILALGVIVYFYNRALYSYDRDVIRFADNEYCMAYMRSKCLPEVVERYRTAIRLGNSIELNEAKKELRRILK